MFESFSYRSSSCEFRMISVLSEANSCAPLFQYHGFTHKVSYRPYLGATAAEPAPAAVAADTQGNTLTSEIHTIANKR